jgi:hypothetical protein
MKKVVLGEGSIKMLSAIKMFDSKQLFSIYDKLMIYSFLIVNIFFGFKEILYFLTLFFGNVTTGIKIACREYIVIVLQQLDRDMLLKNIIS